MSGGGIKYHTPIKLKQNKGFTLIELLAVIVILAIVALIAVPTVLNIIEKARSGAAKSSAISYVKAVETYVVTSELKQDGIKLNKGEKYNVTQNTVINNKNYLAINDLVNLKGSKPTGSKDYIKLGDNKTVNEGQLTISGYLIIIKDGEIISIEKGEYVDIENMALNYQEQTMEKGSSFKLEAIFTPNNASDQRVSYVSSDENIITVDEEGNVTANNIGTAKITVTSKDNTSKKAECNIEVIISATGLEIEPTTTEIIIGNTVQLTGTLTPNDATTNALTWTTSNSEVALVDENGLVTGMGVGEATITATTVNGKSATASITVTPETYLLSEVADVGDYVAYDAGNWTSTASKPTSQGEFGGYTSGQNKASSVSYCYASSYTTSLKGWRVLSVDRDTKTVTIVHAGIPECYYHASGYSSASITNLNNRATSQYLNSDYATSAHNMTYDEAYAITGSTSSTTNDLRYIGESGTTNKSAFYWLAHANSTDSLCYVDNNGSIYNNGNYSFGVRPVVVLKSGIKTTGMGTDAVGQEAWTLVKP